MGIRSTGIGVLIAIVAIGWTASPALAAKHYNAARAAKAAAEARERALERDADAARKAETAANKDKSEAQHRLSEADQEIKTGKTELSAADEAVKKAVQALKDLEKKIEDAEPADSTFSKARTAQDEATKAYREAQERVLTSAEYKAKYAEATKSETSSPSVVRKEALDNDEGVTKAKQDLEIARSTYGKLRAELLERHPEWAEATKAVREAKKRLADATSKLGSELAHKRTASRDLKNAASAAAAADAAAKQDEAKMKRKNAEKHKKTASL